VEKKKDLGREGRGETFLNLLFFTEKGCRRWLVGNPWGEKKKGAKGYGGGCFVAGKKESGGACGHESTIVELCI